MSNATIKDVAKLTGVSVATVSRVLHNLTGYSAETRSKVLQAIEELGYRPNAIARGLINKRTQTIGVLFPDVSSSFSSDILNGIEETSHEHGFSVIVCNTARNGERTLKYLQVLQEKQVDGVIVASQSINQAYEAELMSMNVPVVLINTLAHHNQIVTVKVDDRQAAYDATAYLISNGHREIAMISGNRDDLLAGSTRLSGYRQALEDQGLTYVEDRIAYGDFRYESGRSAMKQLLDTNLPFTALFVASDEMAIGAMGVAHEAGIRIPEDISIIGFDDLLISRMSIPPLTTIHQPLQQMGRSASEMLIRMMDTSGEVHPIIAEHSIVERATVRRLAK
ncbi:MAG: LacI family DNA-binding transcriptional regulator [Candidatus Cohnella colombiensis]|uniref:LacI family DNA-binding transcriptional regulator n=1 Tax=Candidatus Cohnella colombiensis TaxID=3121368 RepID=A0AA95EVX8_9BACL|nr:MAG: LacI family DNA-binding transcriptional regulator [Cohnella sp.]